MDIEDNSNVAVEEVTTEEEQRRLEEREREIAACLVSIVSRNPRFRSKAAERLGELRAAAGAGALIDALGDPNEFVRAAAAQSLGNVLETASADAIDGLLSCLDDKNDFVCSAAIRTLGKLRAHECIDELEPFLDDRNPHIVSDALIALGRMDAQKLVERITPFVEHDNYHVSAAAAQSLAAMGRSEAGERIAARLEQLISSPYINRSFSPTTMYIDALATLKVNAAIPLLTRIATTQVGMRSKAINALMQLDSDDVVPVLLPLLNDPGEKIRTFLLRMIGTRNFRKAAPVVRPLLNDTSVTIRRLALQVLLQFRDHAALGAVRDMSRHDSNPFIRRTAALGLLELAGDEALPDLMALVSDTNTLVRQAVAIGLGRLGRLTPEAVEVLQSLAHDPDPETAEAARAALAEHAHPVAENPDGPSAARPLPIPVELLPQAAELRSLLRAWQSGLGGLLSTQSIDTINTIDQAIQTLTAALNGAGKD